MMKSIILSLSIILAGTVSQAGDLALFTAYDLANTQDIETAELGVVQGHSPKVRALAAMVLRDHSAVRQRVRDIAEFSGIALVPAQTPSDHRDTVARLAALSGEAFDEAYLKYEAGFHTAAIKAVSTQILPNVEMQAFKDHLNGVLPHFHHHLAETLATAKALGYQVD